MQASTTVLLSLALATGAGVATQLALRPADSPDDARQAAVAVEDDGDEDARAQVAAMVAEIAALRDQVAELSLREGGASRAPALDLEQAIASWFEQHHPELAAGAGAPRALEEEPATTESLLAQLLDPSLGEGDRERIWNAAREAGVVDELVAEFEARAEARPDDPEAQVEVGNAYLQQLREVPDGPEKGMLASRADQAFDRALELDPQHWQARFTKAVSLSFWPPVFGKQADAIRQFEVLVGQQASAPIEEHHVHTYELLGNLYMQTGQRDKAAETWTTGAQLFPQNEALANKLAGLGDE